MNNNDEQINIEVHKIEKQKRIKKERHLEPSEPCKRGRKLGQISNPERHLLDGKYSYKPLDKDYFKKYYREVIAHSGPCVCNVCGNTISNSQGLVKHQKTQYCRRAAMMKTIPDVNTLIDMTRETQLD